MGEARVWTFTLHFLYLTTEQPVQAKTLTTNGPFEKRSWKKMDQWLKFFHVKLQFRPIASRERSDIDTGISHSVLPAFQTGKLEVHFVCIFGNKILLLMYCCAPNWQTFCTRPIPAQGWQALPHLLSPYQMFIENEYNQTITVPYFAE